MIRKFWRVVKAVGRTLGSAPRGLVRGSRLASVLVVPAYILSTIPVMAEPAGPGAPPPPPTVVVNKTVPSVAPVPQTPQFSATPTRDEIFRARIFGEPLVALGSEPTNGENAALVSALLTYLNGSGATKLVPLEAFLATHAESPWRPSLLLNLGITYRHAGYFTRSMETLEQAWNAAKDDQALHGRAVADAAIAELLDLNMQFGRQSALEGLVDQVRGREMMGKANAMALAAGETVYGLRHSHERAVPSGPIALWRLLAKRDGQVAQPAAIRAFHATPDGASMAQMADLAQTIGLNLTPAFRERDTPIPLPALAHLRANHFTAIVAETATHYRLDDPLIDGETWVAKEALLDDTSGYFLISGAIPAGWRAATRAELAQKRGKCKYGKAELNPPGEPKCAECEGGPPGLSRGMATYNFYTLRAALYMVDTPVGYDPPRGPGVHFTLTYDQLDVGQPTIFTFSNVGPKWTFDWVSFVKDDPANLSAPVQTYLRDGRIEKVDAFDGQAYAPNRDTRAVLVRTHTSPVRYERRLANGGVEVYAQPDGSLVSPRRVFLTESIDPQGNSITFTYDSNLRLVAVTDEIGQVTTLTYGSITDPLKITKVTDPFGRFATLEYDALGRLTKVTDVIGMSSQFEYGSGDWARALITPYGKTTFSSSQIQTDLGFVSKRWLEAVDPLGGTERLEFRYEEPSVPNSDPANTVPPGFVPNTDLKYNNSFFWSKRAQALHSGDVTKAHMIHWAWALLAPEITPHKLSEKKALEGRVWYAYDQNLGGEERVGPMARPVKIGRVLDDGNAQIYRYEYNNKGHVTRETDPLGREAIYTYAANEIDLLNVKQKNGSNYDLLEMRTYNSQHEPLTITDTAGQVTTYTYNANGTLATIVTPPRGGLSAADRTMTYSYVASGTNGEGHVQTIAEPLGKTTSYAYDAYSRQRTLTETDGYVRTYDYDALDRVTKVSYPDGTFDETLYDRLDNEKRRDRLGRWSYSMHDALGREVSRREADGSTLTQQWCTCGSLDKLVDANGNATTWQRDVQGRVTREVRADSSYSDYVYENTTSRLKQVTDAKLQVKALQYTLDDQLKQITYTNSQYSTANVTFTYDSAYRRPLTMQDGTGTTTYSYNPIGVPPALGAGELESVDGPLTNDTVTATYDELRRLSARSINSVSSSVTFDALGRPTAASNSLGSFTYTYDGSTHRLASVTYPNGQATTYAYFGGTANRLLQEIHNKRSGGTTLSKFQYTYSAEGQIKTWTQQVDSAAAKVLDLDYGSGGEIISATLKSTDPTPSILKRYVYAYDPASNRTDEQIDDGSVHSTFSNVDRLTAQAPGGALRFVGSTNEAATVTVQAKPATTTADNKFSGSAQVSSGTSTVSVTATDPAGNARTNDYEVSQSGSSKTLTYDANGNLTGDGSRTFEWDAENRLIAANIGTLRSEFTYDGVGRRVRIVEKDNGATTKDTRFLWCGFYVCEERDSAGTTVLKRFLPHGWTDGATSYFATRDHLGSVRELMDGTGTLAARYDYDPYGRMTKISGTYDTTVGFTGHYYHAPSGLLLPRYRAYHADLGRWTSLDPAGFIDGPNRYAYAGNDPINRVDADGLSSALFQPPQPLPPSVPNALCITFFTVLLAGPGCLLGGTVGGGGGLLAFGVGVLPGAAVGCAGGAAAGATIGLIAGTIICPTICTWTSSSTKTKEKTKTKTRRCWVAGSGGCTSNKSRGPGLAKRCEFECDDGAYWVTYIPCRYSGEDPPCPTPY